jgi:hypothetical protein
VTIQIQYDRYPQDIGWTMIQDGADEALFFQPYNAITSPFFTQSMTFDNLGINQTFFFKMSDVARDGICCTHGNGSVAIIDNNSFGRSTVLYRLGAESEPYYKVDITIGNYGQATISGETNNYEHSSWPDMETILWAPTADETEWPGNLPSEPKWSLVVNVDLDSHPEEVAWELWKQVVNDTILRDNIADNDWILVHTWNGSSAMGGTLSSTELTGVEPGWYRFVVTDKAQNGICCTVDNSPSMNGFITLTGPLVTYWALGVIWGNNGQYQGQDEIRFKMTEKGYWSIIQWDKNPLAHTQVPSAAPGAEVGKLSSTLGPNGTPRPGSKERPTQSPKYITTSDEYPADFIGLNAGGSSSVITILSSALQVCIVAYLGFSLELV